MSRHWKEQFNPDRHLNYMVTTDSAGVPVEPPADNLVERWVYFVAVCGFTFQFLSLEQLQECLEFFRQKIHPSSRFEVPPLDHWYHQWHERLPQRLFEEAKRVQVIKALERARTDFLTGRGRTVG